MSDVGEYDKKAIGNEEEEGKEEEGKKSRGLKRQWDENENGI